MFIDEIATRLVAQGVGTLGTNIFLSSAAVIPAGDGPYLTVSETGGFKPVYAQDHEGSDIQRPTAQILVRALSEKIARAMIYKAYVALNGIFNVTLSGVFYLKVTARQEPTDMGVLDGHIQIVFNIDAEKQAS